MNRIAFFCGVVFAVGLGLAGMTAPAKVIGFLHVTGAWDPSLALVMLGAIGVHVWFALRGGQAPAPGGVDARLLAGAALFGIGWGIAGYCPGPAVVSLVTLSPDVLAFVGAMLAGMLVHHRIASRTAWSPKATDRLSR